MEAEIGSADYYAERNEYEASWCNHYKSFRTFDMNEDISSSLKDYKKELSNIYKRNY
jgi:hypothetical protein